MHLISKISNDLTFYLKDYLKLLINLTKLKRISKINETKTISKEISISGIGIQLD